MDHQQNNNNILDIILHSILNNEDITSRARDITVAEMLERLKSAGVDETTKMFLVLGLIGILGRNNLPDFASLFGKAYSQPLTCANI